MFQGISLFCQRHPSHTHQEHNWQWCKADLLAGSIHDEDRRETGMWGVTAGMKGSQKFEDKFGLQELASNWSESFLPALGQPRAPQCPHLCVGGETPSR